MYGRKKTPHFISKIQLLSFLNLVQLLKAQDQGAKAKALSLVFWPYLVELSYHHFNGIQVPQIILASLKTL